MSVFAVDFGGSHIGCALVHDHSVVVERTVLGAASTVRQALPEIAAGLRECLDESGLELDQVRGLALGYCGVVDGERNQILSVLDKYTDAVEFDWEGWAEREFALPLRMENDARLALLGEVWAGAGAGAEDVVLVTLGTGIGGAAMLGGRLLQSKAGQAGALGGHLPVNFKGRRCACGAVGCAEAEASTSVLPELCRAHPQIATSLLAREPRLDFETLFRIADAQDRVARDLLTHCIDVWSSLAVGLIHAYGPELVLFGGGVMQRGECILPSIRSYVAKHMWSTRSGVPRAWAATPRCLAAKRCLQGSERMPGYNLRPVTQIDADAQICAEGWTEVGERLRADLPAAKGRERWTVAVELYPGVDEVDVANRLRSLFPEALLFFSNQAFHTPERIRQIFAETLTDDPVFNVMRTSRMESYFEPEALEVLLRSIAATPEDVILVGAGASSVLPEPDCLISGNVSRWELQQRQRAHRCGNLGLNNAGASPAELYKIAYFLDWRVADEMRHRIYRRTNFFLDLNDQGRPRLLAGEVLRGAVRTVVKRPFRVVPFFDPGPWGGQWMRRRFNLPDGPQNYAWGFDCVPEENSVLLGFGNRCFELPAIVLVHEEPMHLLGEAVYSRFGAEFPIRFDLLDTVEGGNLSLQVHPAARYIRKHFGMPYTQDESYYILHAEPGSRMYLGLREGANREAMAEELAAAKQGETMFPAECFVASWPTATHDHFSIPAGTVHCSGAGNVVLEISATPYIFTFKLWDWGRTGLDGAPRPVHLEHGLANICWERTEDWVSRELIDRTEPLGAGEGWREERTGLHRSQFLETRRHWFTAPVPHDTAGNLQVLNLVAGGEVTVSSPSGAFEPMPLHFAETLIVPACVGSYEVAPASGSSDGELATVKAYLRR